jgi:hypothetical protein
VIVEIKEGAELERELNILVAKEECRSIKVI